MNLPKYKTSAYVLTERDDWNHSLIAKNQRMRNKVHVYVIYLYLDYYYRAATYRQKILYKNNTVCRHRPPTIFFFIHSKLDITNKSVGPFLFTISNNSL